MASAQGSPHGGLVFGSLGLGDPDSRARRIVRLVLLLSAVLVAAVSNLDNLAAGFAFGMRETRIGVVPNAVIAAMTMAGTAIAMTSGRALARLMAPWLAADVGALIIIAIGAGTAAAAVRTRRHPAAVSANDGPALLDASPRELVSWREALALGVALSLNNIGAGVGAGIAGIPPLATTALAGAISLVCVGGGSRVGWRVGRVVPGRRAPLVAGLVLVGVGTAMLSGAA